MNIKLCPTCNISKPTTDFYKKDKGLSHKCKPCTLADNKARSYKYIGKYTEYKNEWRKNKYANDTNYKEKILTQKHVYYENHKDTLNERRRFQWANNPLYSARKYYRRKDVKDRTPKWVNLNDILAIYAACPKGYHVDHIIPLRGLIDGRPVTGLHVSYNLQYLTPKENLKKRNKITEKDLFQS